MKANVYGHVPDAAAVVPPELELELLLDEHAVISSSGTPRSATSAFLLICIFPLLARGGRSSRGRALLATGDDPPGTPRRGRSASKPLPHSARKLTRD